MGTMVRKKVFFLLFSMGVGGVEKSLLGLLSTLGPEKYDIHVGLLRKEGGFLQMLPRYVTVHECFCGAWNTVNLPPLATVKSLLKRWRFGEAVVHLLCYAIYKITGDRTLFYRYVLRNEPPIDIAFDEAYAYAGPASLLDFYICRKIKARRRFGWIHFDILKNGIDEVMTRRFYGKYEKIYAVSEEAKWHFDAKFPQFAGKTEVRYNIVPADEVRRLAAGAPTFCDDFRGVRILTVGRLSEEKGQDVTIDTLKILVDKGFDVKWYYVGDGKLRPECERMAAGYGLTERAEFLGVRTNPYGYMKDCDIYVQPSRHEGYCITLAEARCFTAPIVATDFTGAREQLAACPRSVVTGMSAEELAGGIERFL